MNKKNRTSYSQSQAQSPQRSWWWVVGGLALLLVAAGALLLWRPFQAEPDFVPEVSGAPKLAVDQTTLDAGDVKFETPVQAAFRLRNVGDKPLQILNEPQVELIEGCWPPYAVVGATTLQPGQETTLSMDYTMHEGMGGPHEFHVRVQTNDPTQPEMVLVAKSNWVP